MPPRPFTIAIPQSELDDFKTRLARTRWIHDLGDDDWSHGLDVAYMRGLIDYWRSQFDWRRHERALNALPNYRTEIDGIGIHFIHQRGRGPNPLPIVLTHGFPDSILRFAKVIDLLADPGSHGGNPADAFDVVVPSLPGYGFSDPPNRDGMLFHVGDLWHDLMSKQLGYER
jgi:hypothetical protein